MSSKEGHEGEWPWAAPGWDWYNSHIKLTHPVYVCRGVLAALLPVSTGALGATVAIWPRCCLDCGCPRVTLEEGETGGTLGRAALPWNAEDLHCPRGLEGVRAAVCPFAGLHQAKQGSLLLTCIKTSLLCWGPPKGLLMAWL